MGDRSAQVYLANPAIVAASAIAGYITTPALLSEEEKTHHRGTETQRETGADKTHRASGSALFELRDAEPASPPTPFSTAPSRSPVASLPASPSLSSSLSASLRPCGDSSSPRSAACNTSLPRAILIPEPDISTDAIYAGRHTYRNDMSPADMATVIFENLDPVGTPVITPHIRANDIILAGRNFGRGSSREQAATALMHRGIAAVIAVSINATYLRNAINNGLLALECPELEHVLPQLSDRADSPHPRLGPPITLDLESSTLTIHTHATNSPGAPLTLALRPLAPFMRSLLSPAAWRPGPAPPQPHARRHTPQRPNVVSCPHLTQGLPPPQHVRCSLFAVTPFPSASLRALPVLCGFL
jgi:3-isopropylmalate dehydratase small subunit